MEGAGHGPHIDHPLELLGRVGGRSRCRQPVMGRCCLHLSHGFLIDGSRLYTDTSLTTSRGP